MAHLLDRGHVPSCASRRPLFALFMFLRNQTGIYLITMSDGPRPPETASEQDAASASAIVRSVRGSTMPSAAGMSAAAETALAQLRAMSEDPSASGREIDAGEFAPDGTGATGSAFRAMCAIEEERELTEAWSALISLISRLWDEGHPEACLKLIQTARAQIDVPGTMAERIANIAARSESGIRILRAERLFAEGDDAGARGLVEGLEHDPLGYATSLPTRSTMRRRWRLGTLAVAGGTCALLVTLSGWSLVSRFDELTTMPDVELPRLTPEMVEVTEGGADAIASIFRQTSALAEAGHAALEDLPASIESPVTAGLPPAPLAEELDFLAPTPTHPVVVFPDPEAATSQDSRDLPVAEPEPPLMHSALDVEPSGEALVSAGAMIESCALGALALETVRADTQAHGGLTTAEAGRVRDFADKLAAACSALSAEDIATVAGAISPDLIRQTASGLIAGD